MGLRSWAREHLLTMVVLAVVFGTVAAISVLGIAAWVFFAFFTVGSAGALGSLLPLFVVGVLVGTPIFVLTALGAVYALVVKASEAAQGGALQRVASWVESHSETARKMGVSDVAESVDSRSARERADDRIEREKERYVEGEISERELERRISDIEDEEGVHRDHSTIDDELDAERGSDRSRDRESEQA